MKLILVFILLLTNAATGFVTVPKPLVVPSSSSSHHEITTTTTALGTFGDLKGLTQGISDLFKSTDDDEKSIEPRSETVVIDPDFRVAALFLSLGLVLDLIPYIQLTLGPAVTLLGVLFLVQTFRIRFVFDESALELVTRSADDSDGLKSSGENVLVGGANRWDTQSIINYDFFPKGWIDGPVGPILVYFKETQTAEGSWNEGPGKIANDPEKIAAGEAAAGQVHFFPAVCNGQQFRDEFEKRGCRKI